MVKVSGAAKPIDRFEGKFFFLSNFYGAPVLYKDVKFPTSEHAFQAMKSNNPRVWATIAKANGPGVAKRMGRGLKDMRPDWDSVRVPIMKEILRAKFTQNSRLADLLLETGTAELIEGNHWGDTFWGVCEGVGQNQLGKVLMELRVEFKLKARKQKS